MDYREVVEGRHSVRDFRSEPVPREKLERLVADALLAPSSLNEQPWRFYVTTDQTRRKLGKIIAQTTIHLSEYMDVLGPRGYEDAVRWYSSLGEAPVLIAIASPASEDALVRLNRHLSVGAALENLLLSAIDQGLGACNITFSHWVEDEIAELLQVPDEWDVVTIIAVGWPGDVPPVSPEHHISETVWLD